MSRGFRLSETKNCRKYTKYVYIIDKPIDHELLRGLAILGEAKITYFSLFTDKSLDMFKIRNYELACEVSGSLKGHDLMITLKRKDNEIMRYIESEILKWSKEKEIVT